MQSKSVYKVPNGKLLKISLIFDKKNKTIDKISIMGDFFAYPEEAIESIEKELVNTKIEKKVLIKKINDLIVKNDFQFIGVDAEGFTTGILMCLE